jgi:hypothetical protein
MAKREIQSMYEDGWQDVVIAGKKLLKLVINGGDEILYCQFTGSGYMTQNTAEKIQSKLGPADKIHSLKDGITTLEYWGNVQ